MPKGPILPLLSMMLLLLVLFDHRAQAYIDPGSASYVSQLFAGVLFGGVFLVHIYWDRVVTTVHFFQMPAAYGRAEVVVPSGRCARGAIRHS